MMPVEPWIDEGSVSKMQVMCPDLACLEVADGPAVTLGMICVMITISVFWRYVT